MLFNTILQEDLALPLLNSQNLKVQTFYLKIHYLPVGILNKIFKIKKNNN